MTAFREWHFIVADAEALGHIVKEWSAKVGVSCGLRMIGQTR